MKPKQLHAIKLLEDAIKDIKANNNMSAKDNIRIAVIYLDDVINVPNLG